MLGQSSFTLINELSVEPESLDLLLVLINFIWLKEVSHATDVGGRLSRRSNIRRTLKSEAWAA